MKLIVFTEKDNEACELQSDLISKLVNKNLLDGITQEERNSIDEETQVLISNVLVERGIKIKKNIPIISNFYKINTYPTVVFINEGEIIYKWENKVPSLIEVITSIKNYIKILKLDTMDYNYDPEE